jgi:hypothetical protein
VNRNTFYLGCSQTTWLEADPDPGQDAAPLFIAVHRLRRYLRNKRWPRPTCTWAMDSGGFNHVRMNGGWTLSAGDYAEQVWEHDQHLPGLSFAASQDWMCEPQILARTGLTVLEHQERTVANYIELCRQWERLVEERGAARGDQACPVGRMAERCPFMPVLQGWSETEYLRCADMFEASGVHLPDCQIVGLGSVCRRQATSTVVRLVERIKDELSVNLHGFGVRRPGLRAYGELLSSADSHAWSYAARRRETLCRHGEVRWERNCRRYAMQWRAAVLEGLPDGGPLDAAPRPRQTGLF